MRILGLNGPPNFEVAQRCPGCGNLLIAEREEIMVEPRFSRSLGDLVTKFNFRIICQDCGAIVDLTDVPNEYEKLLLDDNT